MMDEDKRAERLAKTKSRIARETAKEKERLAKYITRNLLKEARDPRNGR